MTANAARAGWYRDPDDPSRYQHWDGRTWSGRWRSLPAWMVADTEVAIDPAWGNLIQDPSRPTPDGPVREQPMPAGAPVARRQLGDGVTTHRLIPATALRHTHPGPPWRWPGSSFGDPRPGWAPSRRPLLAFCALVGAAMVIMATSALIGFRHHPAVAASVGVEDPGFTARAASICEVDLRPLHTAVTTLSPDADAVAPAGATRDVNAVQNALTALERLPVRADATDAVQGWLSEIGAYVSDQEELMVVSAPAAASSSSAATSTVAGSRGRGDASSGGGSSPPVTGSGVAEMVGGGAGAAPASPAQIAERVAADVNQADIFAGANGLAACSLAATGGGDDTVVIP